MNQRLVCIMNSKYSGCECVCSAVAFLVQCNYQGELHVSSKTVLPKQSATCTCQLGLGGWPHLFELQYMHAPPDNVHGPPDEYFMWHACLHDGSILLITFVFKQPAFWV